MTKKLSERERERARAGGAGTNGGVRTIECAALGRGVIATVGTGAVDLNAAVERAKAPLAQAARVRSRSKVAVQIVEGRITIGAPLKVKSSIESGTVRARMGTNAHDALDLT